MSVTLRGSPFSNNSGGVAVTSLNFTLPTGIVAGDVGYLIVDTANTARTGVAPTGWTMVGGTHASTTALRSWFYRRTMDGSESGATVTPALNNTGVMQGSLVVFQGGDATHEVIAGPTTDAGDNTTMATVAVTPNANDALLISLTSVRYTSLTTSGLTTTPSGWTKPLDHDDGATTGTNGRHGVLVVTKQLSGQSGVSQGSAAGTWASTARDHTWTLALAPAAPTAAGTASLALTAGGVGVGVTAGTASLALTGSGAGVGRAAGTAALALTLNGAGTGLAAGTAALALTLTGAGVAVPKASTLTENFSAALDGAKWTTGGGTPVVTGGQLQITPVSTYPFIQTVGNYDLTGSSAFVQFAQAPDASADETTMEFRFGDGTNAVYVLWYNSTLVFRERVANVNSDTSIAYSPTSHAFVRLRESGGTVFWDTSPDGSTWTNRRSKASSLILNNSPINLTAGIFGTDPTPGVAIFDNVNLVSTPTASGTANLALTAGGAGVGVAAGSAALALNASGAPVALAAGTASLALTLTGAGKAAAAGVAVLSLNATGAPTVPAAASASLSLNASGIPRAPASGTASVALTASGPVGAVAAGTAALALTASGPARAVAAGTAALALTASGPAQAAVAGTATLALTAGASLRAAVAGTAVLALTAEGDLQPGAEPTSGSAVLTLVATGAVGARAAGTAALQLVATASPAAPVAGSGSLSLTASSGVAAVAAGTAVLVISAGGQVEARAVGSGALLLEVVGLVGSEAAGAGELLLTALGLVEAPAFGQALLELFASGAVDIQGVVLGSILSCRLRVLAASGRAYIPSAEGQLRVPAATGRAYTPGSEGRLRLPRATGRLK